MQWIGPDYERLLSNFSHVKKISENDPHLSIYKGKMNRRTALLFPDASRDRIHILYKKE
jgi:hypothetical protein